MALRVDRCSCLPSEADAEDGTTPFPSRRPASPTEDAREDGTHYLEAPSRDGEELVKKLSRCGLEIDSGMGAVHLGTALQNYWNESRRFACPINPFWGLTRVRSRLSESAFSRRSPGRAK